MSTDDQLDSILDAWQREFEAGRDAPAAELCRECPDLVPEAERRIGLLRRMAGLHRGRNSDQTLTADHAATASAFDHAATIDSPDERSGANPGTGRSGPLPGYELLGELGRGGMGVVYRARDTSLCRDVAVKVLQNHYPPAGPVARRFVAESQITSQLQHPGVPPIHQIGALADGRPYLVMKLIKGRTLDKLLKERSAPTENRGRFVAAFEQVCQTVGYAHAHGVIHRDLKPANIMVGTFGEVQVMDWGLSKSLGDPRPVEADPTAEEARTAIGSFREAGSATRTGSVMGTPAFMSPEQAGGEVEKVDARSDVFGLGAVLCVILTGEPPYIGPTAEAVLLIAIRGQLTGAQERLGTCEAEPELVALCRRCLSVEPSDRPKDANEVAAAVAGFRAAAEERARRAELDRVRAAAAASEQRKRRKVQLALAATVGLLLTAGGAFAWHSDHQRAEQELAEQRAEVRRKAAEARLEGERDAEARSKAAQARQGIDAGLRLASDLCKRYQFKGADAALAQAATLATGGAPERLAEVEQARSDLAFVVALDDIRFRKWIWIAEPGGEGGFNTRAAPLEYRKTFADRGLALETVEPTEVVGRLVASPVKANLVAAVDDWALYEPDPDVRSRLLEIARRADPGPWTNRLRDPSVWNNKAVLTDLAASADPTTAPATLSLLAELLRRLGGDPSAMLIAARAEHPADFELAFALAQDRSQRRDGSQVGPYEAARALRPDNLVVWFNLGVALHARGDAEGAAAAYRGAIRLNPDLVQMYISKAVAQAARGDTGDGVRLSAKLGIVTPDIRKDTEGAIRAYRAAIRLEPGLATAHNGLGVALDVKGDTGGAIAAYKEAIRLDPGHAPAHTNMGVVFFRQKNYQEAIARARDAIKANPKYSNAHALLGAALRQSGDVQGGNAALAEAGRLDPRWAPWLANLPPVSVVPPPREKK